ncbi:unnamed protein product [Prorocentrum cordatum]|uniref:Phospholipase B-like n=1 Tax=Prorocentrum cordatum TaxID=2364126 RepID=A0ABN9X929_9DINO|nr:unnamed protein product [Polarella glacialis]
MALKVTSVLAVFAFAHAVEVQEVRAELSATARANATHAKKKRTARKGACDCLPWAGVYYDRLAACGRAQELYFLSKFGFSAAYAATEPISGLPHKVCNDFLKNLKDASCINVDLLPFPADDNTDKQWCYVSNDCDVLNGGEDATNTMGFQQAGWNNLQSVSNLSWKKVCDQASGDVILKYKTVEELIALAEANDVSKSRMMRLAYPVLNATWSEAMWIMEAIDNAWDGSTSLNDIVDSLTAPPATYGDRLPQVFSMVTDAVKSEIGTILDTPGHGDNFHVIKGREVWIVQRIGDVIVSGAHRGGSILGDMAYLGGHFSWEFDVNCTIGCATSRVAALDLETM